MTSNPPFSSEQLAKRWGVSAQHVRDMIKAGALRHFKVGRLIRIPAIAVEEFEQCQTTGSSSIEDHGTLSGPRTERRSEGHSAPKVVKRPNAA